MSVKPLIMSLPIIMLIAPLLLGELTIDWVKTCLWVAIPAMLLARNVDWTIDDIGEV